CDSARYFAHQALHSFPTRRSSDLVSEACFNYVSGYGYNDLGRDTLEEVYASTFHTEAALVRPQITCGTHALALALAANLRPGDEDRKSTRLNSSHVSISYAVFCLQ